MNLKGILWFVVIFLAIMFFYPRAMQYLGKGTGFDFPEFNSPSSTDGSSSGTAQSDSNPFDNDDLQNSGSGPDITNRDIPTQRDNTTPSDVPTSYGNNSGPDLTAKGGDSAPQTTPATTGPTAEPNYDGPCRNLKRVALADGKYKFYIIGGDNSRQPSAIGGAFYDARSFYDCYTPVKKYRNGTFDIIDQNGNKITEHINEFKAIREFHEGVAGAFNYEDEFIGYINIYARPTINLKRLFPNEIFIDGTNFRDGKAYIQKATGGYYQINAKGRKIKELESCVIAE